MMADEAELLVAHDTQVCHVHYSNMAICFPGAASLAALRDLMTVRVQGDAVPCSKDMKFVDPTSATKKKPLESSSHSMKRKH